MASRTRTRQPTPAARRRHALDELHHMAGDEGIGLDEALRIEAAIAAAHNAGKPASRAKPAAKAAPGAAAQVPKLPRGNR